MRRASFFRGMSVIVSVAIGAATLSVGTSSAATTYHATATFPSALMSSLPLARLHFNGPINAAHLPAVITYPSLSTKWQQIGANEVQSVATSPMIPSTNYLINVPTRISCTSASCSATVRVTRTVASNGSIQWLQEILASLNYLPVSFTPTNPSAAISSTPVPGTFSWRFGYVPPALRALWRAGVANVVTKGAIMRFQNVHQLATSGVADAATWSALLHAAATSDKTHTTYNYVDVNEASPQTLTLYVNGRSIYHTTVNTGIAQAPTETGTYPVYVRFTTTTMSGTNPDGSKYHDTGIPWVSYFHGGDALHGFIRSSYGWPQSLGCVEMRFNDAHTVFPYTPIGTLVTVR